MQSQTTSMNNATAETSGTAMVEKQIIEKSAQSDQCPLCGSGETSPFLSAPDRFHLRREVYFLSRCTQCSCVWLTCPPPPNEMSLHYSTTYHKAIASSGEAKTLKRWAKQTEIVAGFQGSALLDIGCSSGAFLSTLKDREWRLYGLEIDSEQASSARAKTSAEIFTGDLFDASYPKESFDVVTMFHVLEHFDRPRERMARIFDWLRPGGVVYLGLPNIDSWEARLFKSYWFGLEMPRHFFLYSPSSLRGLLASVGFHEVWLQTPGSYATQSIRYICDDAAQRLGISRVPLAAMEMPGIPSRIVRKAFRMGLGFPLMKISEAAGKGANLEGVFRKG